MRMEEQSLLLKGVGNARELGGYVTEDGRRVKKGIFLRSAALGDATQEDIRRLREVYHLSTVIDLRSTFEAQLFPEPVIEGVRARHLLILAERAMEGFRAASEETEGRSIKEAMAPENMLNTIRLALESGIVHDGMYIDFFTGEEGKAGFRSFLEEVLSLPEGEAILFHCSQGKDRTGCAAMLILTLLGVPQETIMEDYLLTNAFNAPLIEGERRMLKEAGYEGEELESLLSIMDQVRPKFLQVAMDWMTKTYGSPLGYLKAELGIGEEDIERSRERFLEEG